jgi:hypothetical protein
MAASRRMLLLAVFASLHFVLLSNCFGNGSIKEDVALAASPFLL